MNEPELEPGAARSPDRAERPPWWRGGWLRGGWLCWALLALPPLAAAGLVAMTLVKPAWNEPLFVKTTYYALFLLVGLYVGVRLTAVQPDRIGAWCREHLAGLVVTAVVGTVAILAVEPAFRVLADEANLVGVSKHLYYHRTANFPLTGKWYFENYWTLSSTSDRRPALYPFLVSLLHVVRGYHVEHAFHVNAMVFFAFVFGSYRLAKSLGGEQFGVLAALLVGAHANVLVCARSGGFDLLATSLTVAVVHGFVEASRERTPQRIAVVVLRLCLLANVRYEGTALLLLGGILLLATRVVTLNGLRGYRWLYSIVPLLLLPRYWQSIAKANDAEQPLSASLFSFDHFWNNSGEYLRIVLKPLDVGAPHAPLVVALGLAGLLALLVQAGLALRRRAVTWHGLRATAFITTIVGLEIVLCFSYFWGRPLHPASLRLFLWLDVCLGFTAAWLLTLVGRWVSVAVSAFGGREAPAAPVPATDVPAALAPGALVPGALVPGALAPGALAPGALAPGALVPAALAIALLAMALPTASEARFTNSLTLTRQAATVWRFLAALPDRRFVVLTDRPGMFTILDYGAIEISSLRGNRSLLFEQSRSLFGDIYLIQEVNLATHRPEPKFNPWPDVATETVLEFQNAENASVRIARVVPPPVPPPNRPTPPGPRRSGVPPPAPRASGAAAPPASAAAPPRPSGSRAPRAPSPAMPPATTGGRPR